MLNLFFILIAYLLSSYVPAFGESPSSIQEQENFEKEYSEIMATDQAIQKENYKKGIHLYQQYLEKHPNDKGVVITLFRLQLMQGNYQEAKRLLDLYLSRFGKDDTYLSEKTRYYVLLNKSEAAFKTIVDQRHFKIVTMLVSAQRAIQKKDFKKGLDLYQKYLEKNPNDKGALIEYIRAQLEYGDYPASEDLLEDYLDRFGKDDAYLTEKARYFILTKKPQEALAIVGAMLKKNPSNKMLLNIEQDALNLQGRINQALILVEARQAAKYKDYKRAIRYYQQYLNKNPNNKMIMLVIVRLELISGNPETALTLLSDYENKFGQDSGYVAEKARFFVMNSQPDSALAILNPALEKNPNNKYLLDVKEYALVVKERQNLIIQKQMLAVAKQAAQNKDYKKATALYQEYLNKYPNDKNATLDIIRLQLQHGSLEDAMTLLALYESRFGKNDAYLAEKARYFVLTHKAAEALTIIDSLLKKAPSNKRLLEIKKIALDIKAKQERARLAAIRNQAEQFIKYKDYKKAIALYQKYLSIDSDDKDITIILIRLQVMQTNYSEAEKLFADYKKRFGVDNTYLTEKARYLVLAKKPDEALKIIDPLVQKKLANKELLKIKQNALALKSQQEKADLTLMLSEADQAIKGKDYKKGIALYKEYLQKNPNDKSVILTLIHIQLQLGKYPEVEKLLIAYLGRFGLDKECLIEKAHYLIVTNKFEDALTITDALLKNDPTNKTVLNMKQYALALKAQHEKATSTLIVTAAKNAKQNKDYRKSIILYQEYLSKNPNDKVAILSLIHLYLREMNYSEAEKLLASYLGKFGQDTNYLTEKARYLVLTNKFEEGLSVIDPLLKKDPYNKSLLDVKQFALSLKAQREKATSALILAGAKQALQNKDYKKSINLYQQYLTKNPYDKAIVLTLVQLHLSQSNYYDAEKLLTEYVQKFGQDGNYLTEKAHYLVLTNNLEDALVIVESLLKRNPSNKKLLAMKKYALKNQEKQKQEQQKLVEKKQAPQTLTEHKPVEQKEAPKIVAQQSPAPQPPIKLSPQQGLEKPEKNQDQKDVKQYALQDNQEKQKQEEQKLIEEKQAPQKLTEQKPLEQNQPPTILAQQSPEQQPPLKLQPQQNLEQPEKNQDQKDVKQYALQDNQEKQKQEQQKLIEGKQAPQKLTEQKPVEQNQGPTILAQESSDQQTSAELKNQQDLEQQPLIDKNQDQKNIMQQKSENQNHSQLNVTQQDISSPKEKTEVKNKENLNSNVSQDTPKNSESIMEKNTKIDNKKVLEKPEKSLKPEKLEDPRPGNAVVEASINNEKIIRTSESNQSIMENSTIKKEKKNVDQHSHKKMYNSSKSKMYRYHMIIHHQRCCPSMCRCCYPCCCRCCCY